MANYAEDHAPTADELREDAGQSQCLDCGEWFTPTGEPFHPGCRKQINEVRIFMSI